MEQAFPSLAEPRRDPRSPLPPTKSKVRAGHGGWRWGSQGPDPEAAEPQAQAGPRLPPHAGSSFLQTPLSKEEWTQTGGSYLVQTP